LSRRISDDEHFFPHKLSLHMVLHNGKMHVSGQLGGSAEEVVQFS
jgi:hypothetical protein